MDKYELRMRIDEIEDLIKKKEFGRAVEIADTINWSKVKQMILLCHISDLYKVNRRYDDARLLLEMAYDMHPNRKDIVSALCDLCIRMEDIVGSTEYYKKYVQMDQNGVNRYILLYKIYDMQGVSIEEKIRVLEDLKKREPIANKGKWSYELAKLYEESGLTTKCVEECDELIMLVREGKYVKKAMELKMLHQQLTQSQEALYKSIIISETGEFPTDLRSAAPVQNEPAADEAVSTAVPEEIIPEEQYAQAPLTDETGAEAGAYTGEEAAEVAADELVKTVDVGQYSTINIQKALEESIKGTLREEKSAETVPEANIQEVSSPEESFEQMQEDEEPDDNTIYMPINNMTAEETPSEEANPVNEKKQDTGEMQEVIFPDEPATGDTIIYDRNAVKSTDSGAVSESIPTQDTDEEIEESSETEPDRDVNEQQTAQDVEPEQESSVLDGINVTNVSKEELISLIDQKVAVALENAMAKRALSSNINPPKAIQGLLSEEYDGQIQMVIPEKKQVEKQITGQIELKEYLNDWESSKKRRQRNQEEKINKLVSQHTDNLLAAFENETNNSVLMNRLEQEAIEKEKEEQKAKEERRRQKEEELRRKAEEEEKAKEAEQAEENAAIITEAEEPEPIVDVEPDQTVETEPVETSEEIQEDEAEEVMSTPEVKTSTPETDKKQERQKTPKEEEEIAAAEAEAIDDDDDDDTGRPMTDEESALFSQFVQTKKGKKELLKALDSISLASYAGNVCVTGETGEESVDLAKNVVQYAKATDGNFSGKIGKVTGSSLNDKDIDMLVEKLSNGGLIIEKAGDMTEDTASKLFKALNQENLGILVVLQDSRKSMNRFLSYNPALESMFNVHIEIEELSDDALVAYGRKYAERREFAIDDMGILALHTRIDEMQTSDHIVTVTDVRDIVDEAIAHATKFNPKHFTDIVFGKRYNDEDMIILKEKDFIR